MRRLGIIAALAVVLAAGCGGDDESASSSSETGTIAPSDSETETDTSGDPETTDPAATVRDSVVASSAAPADDETFPVTIEHLWGSTTITEAPERVVVLGVTDADAVLALGTTPVAVTGYSFYPETGLGPWTDGYVKGEQPVYLGDSLEVNIERVAGLEPDLIVGVSAGFEQPVYDKLSEIAPTLVRPKGHAAYTVPRDEATRMIARALGRVEAGERLIERANRAYADAAAAHPEFAGKVGTVMLPYDGQYGAYLPGDNRGQALDQLGFELPEGIAALDGGESYYVPLSREQLELVDGDVLVVLADVPATRRFVESDEILQSLGVVANGGLVITDTDTRGAMTYNTVLSVPYVVDRLVPQLASALE